MSRIFADRADAGRQLAERLGRYAGRENVIVLGLARGGVPVASEIARELRAPMEVYLVRKLGTPGHEELAMGAIADGGITVLNEAVLRQLNPPKEVFERILAAERLELERRGLVYRGQRPAPHVTGQIAILVDDGIATGSTMRAAVLALQKQVAGKIVIATPVIAASTSEELSRIADELVAVITPVEFHAVGQWYSDFEQISDEDIINILSL
jgi:putative phosphoribosyl transferase